MFLSWSNQCWWIDYKDSGSILRAMTGHEIARVRTFMVWCHMCDAQRFKIVSKCAHCKGTVNLPLPLLLQGIAMPSTSDELQQLIKKCLSSLFLSVLLIQWEHRYDPKEDEWVLLSLYVVHFLVRLSAHALVEGLSMNIWTGMYHGFECIEQVSYRVILSAFATS